VPWEHVTGDPVDRSAPLTDARTAMTGRTDRARVVASIAAIVGLGHAAVSAYWALGGERLLETIGGDIERWGRERGPTVVAALWSSGR
jgi:hypothetical protein